MPIYMPEIKLNKSNTYAKIIVHHKPFSAGISAVLIINAEVISPRNGEYYFSSNTRELLDELIAERPVTKSIGFPPPMRCRSAD